MKVRGVESSPTAAGRDPIFIEKINWVLPDRVCRQP